MRKIKIRTRGFEREAELNDSAMANSFYQALPVKGKANRWGDEIYFRVPVKHAPGEAKGVVDEGDVAFWPPGNAFCIFFGPTPVSTEREIRPASEVIILGKIKDDLEVFKWVKDGQEIIIERGD
ncbi:hypothetical protein IBX65_01370 [Candidatus Aerophobetes bacterium]|nr:hypothetical protein [Candidatus Aerophobetes bacterium]